MSLNDSLKNQVKNKISSYHQSLLKPPISNEDDYIKRTVNAFQNFRPHSGGQSLSTRSTKVDSTPIVSFTPCSPAFSSHEIRREIGDILFVYKYILNGRLVGHRASLVQTKYTNGTRKSWSIDTAQFCLMNHWHPFELVKPKKFSKPYTLSPYTRSWATYGFVGPNATEYPPFFSAQRIQDIFSMPSSKHFSFNLYRMPAIWVYDVGFLSLFLQNLIGENLQTSLEVKSLVDDLYKIAGLIPDPPGEFEWNDDERSEEEKSFGIIEFTIAEEAERE